MPIHLPPLTRRDFLRRSLLAGAGAALAPRLFAAGKPAAPHTFALLSDTHIDANLATSSRGVVMADHLKTVAAEIAALPRRPENLLINGDCAYLRGEPGDYTNLVALLKPLREAGIPVHLTLGNHDARENFWAGVPETKPVKRPLADKHAAIVKTARANWLLLDSLDKVNVTPGVIGEAQLKWLGDALDANADKPAIIVAHHNHAETDHKGGLMDSEALFAVLAPRKQVKAYFFGHTHNWRTMKHESGIHLVNLPPVAYVFKPTRPNGWVQAWLQPDGLKLKLNALDQKHPEHGQTVELNWRS